MQDSGVSEMREERPAAFWRRAVSKAQDTLLPRTRWLLVLLPVLAPFLLLVASGVASVDFGYHWDENNHHLGVAKQFVLNGHFLPHHYVYPSLNAYLTFAGVLPYVVPKILNEGFYWPAIREYLLYSVFNNNPTYPLNVRKLFLFISALALIWVYLYKLKRGRHWLEALLAAALLGFSWEVAYHLRFIAADGVVMMFGALTLLLATLAVRDAQRKRLWLTAAAIAAGLGTGTKYPAGLLLLPVLAAAYLAWDKRDWLRGLAPTLLRLSFIFGLTYLIVTPGTVLDPLQFYKDVMESFNIYRTGHGQQTVQPGFDFLSRLTVYLSAVALSPYLPIALFFSLLALVGLYSFYRESKAETLLFLSFPLPYIAYFVTKAVMFVRNLQVLIPFLAILAARGAAFVFEKLRARGLRVAWGALVAALLAVNAGWLLYSAGTIRDRGTERFKREFAAYVQGHPETTFLVSGEVRDALVSVRGEAPPNVTTELTSDVDMVAVYFYESMEYAGNWPVNWPGSAPEWFGPLEINLDYYAFWQGDDRILYMPLEKAQRIGIALVQGE